MARSYLGQEVDVSAIIQQQGDNIAVGNMKVNGRGDVIDSSGNVVKTSDQRVREHYKSSEIKTETVSLKPPVVDDIIDSPLAKPKVAKKARTEIVDESGNISYGE